MSSFPSITGKQLIALLIKDGWIDKRRANHGVALFKYDQHDKRNLVTVIPDKTSDMPTGTLMDILGMKQTRIGKKGLLVLIKKYGV